MRRALAAGSIMVAATGGGCGSFGAADDDEPVGPSPTEQDAGAASDGGSDAPGGGDAGGGSDGSTDAGIVPLRVFITAGDYVGGSLATNLETRCQTLANDAGLGGKWVPWLSNGTRQAAAAVTGDGPWQTLGGAVVAKDKAALLGGTLGHAIDRDQNNDPRSANVWTGTTYEGLTSADHCNGWKASVGTGRIGQAGATDAKWTDWQSVSCPTNPLAIYCFEIR